MSSAPNSKSNTPCIFFKRGVCGKGEGCKFSHAPPAGFPAGFPVGFPAAALVGQRMCFDVTKPLGKRADVARAEATNRYVPCSACSHRNYREDPNDIRPCERCNEILSMCPHDKISGIDKSECQAYCFGMDPQLKYHGCKTCDFDHSFFDDWCGWPKTCNNRYCKVLRHTVGLCSESDCNKKCGKRHAAKETQAVAVQFYPIGNQVAAFAPPHAAFAPPHAAFAPPQAAVCYPVATPVTTAFGYGNQGGYFAAPGANGIADGR